MFAFYLPHFLWNEIVLEINGLGSVIQEQSVRNDVVYQTQRAGWESILFLCNLILSLWTAILADKCPYPLVIRDPHWGKITPYFYYGFATPSDTVRQLVQTSVISPFPLPLCSLLWSSVKQDKPNNKCCWQHSKTLLTPLCLKLQGEISLSFMFFMGHSFSLWREFVSLVIPKLSLCLLKNIYLCRTDEAHFWSLIHWRHRNPPGSHIKQGNVHRCLPPLLPRSPPHTPTRFQAPVAFFYSADERDCLGLALMNWHYY